MRFRKRARPAIAALALGLGVAPARAAEKSPAPVARGPVENSPQLKRGDIKSEASGKGGSADKSSGVKAGDIKREASGKGGSAKGVSGSLREMGLPDMVQVLFHGRKTGKLTIKNDGGKAGEIHFLEGAIANAILGNLQGADAFYAMVRFTDGEFSLDPTFVPPKRLVAESAEALLLEGMRRMDEGI